MNSVLRLSGLVVCVGAAYYTGAAVGLSLKLPHATPSVLWPPNAILTSTLLLTPYRVWPVALLAALPAHVMLEAGAGWPIALVIALFATNCSEALIAAGGLRWLSDSPARFDSLRRLAIFVGVVVIAAPLLSSFLDAAAVTWVRNEPYWMVWRVRLFSNMLTELTVVPAIITVVTSARAWSTTASPSRLVEALILSSSLLVVTTIVLNPVGPGPMATALADRAPLALLLPFLLWGATRFGPGGASLTLLASTLAVAGASVHSRGPFQGLSPADTTLALQMFLIVVSLTLLGVAALVEERRLVQQSLSKELAFEALLARLSGAFVQLPSDRMRETFDEWLGRIGEFFEIDCLMLFQHSATEDPTRISAWAAPTAGGVPEVAARGDFPWTLDRVVRRQTVIVENVTQFPQEATRDRRSFEEYGFKSGLAIPLLVGDSVLGALAFTSVTSVTRWPVTLVAHLQLMAEVFGNALARKQSEDMLRTSEAMKSAILTSLTSGVVVVDRDGRIIAINEEWRRIVGDDAPSTATEVGANYLDFYHATPRAGHGWAAEVAAGIEAVLRGARRTFVVEYVCDQGILERWFVMRVVPLDRPEGGAVATHSDISERKRAELEAQRTRGELAHVSRVSTMGALTASLAHQLNQPLTAILANAQAAQRFLQAPSPDLNEVRAILADIVDDERRASEVIVRLRDLLRKRDASVAEVDVNVLMSDVVRLVDSDAVIRNAKIELELETSPVIVSGDRVQLQQVVLNLIVNALEAVADRPSADRKVIARCTRSGDELVISVIDTGPGFAVGTEDDVFEAFYSTKYSGMGMGLSIARSIVEAHGGAIRAMNNPSGGATVSCRLPLAQAPVA